MSLAHMFEHDMCVDRQAFSSGICWSAGQRVYRYARFTIIIDAVLGKDGSSVIMCEPQPPRRGDHLGRVEVLGSDSVFPRRPGSPDLVRVSPLMGRSFDDSAPRRVGRSGSLAPPSPFEEVSGTRWFGISPAPPLVRESKSSSSLASFSSGFSGPSGLWGAETLAPAASAWRLLISRAIPRTRLSKVEEEEPSISGHVAIGSTNFAFRWRPSPPSPVPPRGVVRRSYARSTAGES